MGTVRAMITRLVFLAALAVSGGAVWLASQQNLTVDMDRHYSELFVELAHTDLAHASTDDRLQLVSRLDRAFRLGADWRQLALDLDESSWSTFRQNLFILLHEWLVDRANTYHELGVGERRGPERQRHFINDQIDTVMAWSAAAPSPTAEQAQLLQSRVSVVELYARLQQWTEDADAEQQAQLRAFIDALVRRAVERQAEFLSVPGT
ncbi:MAG: hypothetical protein KDA63_00870 [Planctomycetales bacterium]|nr:hypothetical protein [Planctomycetales bacterium]